MGTQPRRKYGRLAAIALVGLYCIVGMALNQMYGISLPGFEQSATAPEQSATAPEQSATVPNGRVSDDLPAKHLKQYGDIKQSPAGLRYGPGGREGDRLKHVMRHTRDMTERSIHGVFDVRDERSVVLLIDDAYRKIQSNAAGVSREREGSRTEYTVDMGRRIGFIGGQVGQRKNFPPCEKLRLILEAKNVITAYPVDR